MISLEKITYKLSQLDEFLSILKKMENSPVEAFLKDKIQIGAAKYYLQVSIACCLDIANHIIASESYRAPNDYADTFKVLEENSIITPEFSQRLRQMAKFRNRLVHLYGDIEDSYVFEFINDDIQDLKKFKEAIVTKYMK
jgi:uncharacterized protein YutE (UPF0331/DUF86 family)